VEVLNSMKLGDGERTADLLRRNILRLCSFLIQYTDTPMPMLITGAIESPSPHSAPSGRWQH
jgi:hypothetical protein